jgi:Raf kinase inhibitor-like YbhB/YbcL family protein
MNLVKGLAAILIGSLVSCTAVAQTMQMATERSETQTSSQLLVTSSAFQSDAPIPARHSAYGAGISPQLQWSSISEAKSYALVIEDPDAGSPAPVLHWIVWNIPSTVTSLPEGLGELGKTLVQGRNSHGTNVYFGPRPPLADPPHHYHFQVFALDRMLAVPAGADREAFLSAANGHVIAKGELVGTYQQAMKPGG